MKPKSLTLAKKATLGAAATGAVFNLQHQIDAAVVYSGLQNISATDSGPSPNMNAYIDVGGALGNEMIIAANAATTFAIVRLRANTYVGGANLWTGGGANIRKLASGANISAGAVGSWVGNNFGAVRDMFTFGNYGQWLVSNQTGFAGFRFNPGDGLRYGWIRLKWTDNADADVRPNTITAIDWAYESTPNTTIQAGNIGAAVPEPSRALLALAGLGALGLRRRRKAE